MKIFMAHAVVILSGPKGYAIREPQKAKGEGLLRAVRSKFTGVDVSQEGQGIRPASLR
ncbi:MAG: hypothetical protein JRN46_01155 [Nitrososphaerota archaeon]|nr:hypothetical protein [Nitrososphaerota archaeon]